MSFKLGNRVKETSTTTGSGTYTLAGAVTGYQALGAVLSTGDTTFYLAEDGVNWEIGVGTFNSGAGTLARTTILESSNSNAAVNWGSGTRNISIVDVAKYSTPITMSEGTNRGIQIADEAALSSATGNARGAGAVDLQIKRVNAAMVASGAESALVGGINNTASGGYAACVGGSGNVAAANASLALGFNAQTTVPCQVAQNGGPDGFSGFATAQHSSYVLGKVTTNGTQAALVDNERVAYIPLPNDSTFAFDILIVARRTDADNESAAYQLVGCIDRNGNAASTALVGSVTKTVIAEDTPAWDVDAQADTTNGGLKILVTGEAAKSINWVAHIRTIETIG